MPRGSWVMLVESGDWVRCMDIVVDFPTIVADAITFPFDKVFNLAIVHSTIQDRFDLELLCAINEDRRGRWLGATTGDRVR